jgi:hydroxyacylglutathione hydrolase
MKVDVIPALGDNYIFLISHASDAVVVDPGAALPVEALLRQHALRLTGIIVTHPHGDHTAGCAALKQHAACKVAGPAAGGFDRSLREGDVVELPGGRARVLETPGHTASDISFYDETNTALWCGDTLFAGGCGRVFGGGYATMWQSLSRLRDLPDETRIYCGHEYTVDNLAFAADLEPDNAMVQQRLEAARATVARREATVPSLLGLEKRTNPFLRADSPALRRAVGMPDAPAAEVFAEIRRRKDRW